MPYTPPAHSPAASPMSSRSSSISFHERPATTSFNPPRSSTFNREKVRRSASHSNQSSAVRPELERRSASYNRNGSLHQSPSPINHGSAIPTGAVMSPPDSQQNSSDDDEAPLSMEKRSRGRQLQEDDLDRLRESLIPITQRRACSPDGGKHTSPADMQPLSTRKYSHSRSTSDSSFLRDLTNKSSSYNSDVEDEGYRIAPPMIRKKSGELVKSSLKTPNRSRPCSVPSTPTYPKVVHFDSHLEHVRHFLQAEKPTAVSAGSSPVECHGEGSEFPFDDDSDEDNYRSPPFEWEIVLPNFPTDLSSRKHLPVRVERIYLSTDKLNLLGTVAVANISFQKLVVVRFTLDYWQTVSEVTAEYNSDVRRKQREENVDRFTFKIKLHDQANLETKSLFFCVRYQAGGQELWDNNNSMNFQVDFKKKLLARNGKGNSSKPSLPRSRPSASTLPRPMSMPNLDNLLESFGDVKIAPVKPLERTTIQVQLPPSKKTEDSDPVRRITPSGNAFSTRYDFTTSLASTIPGAPKSVLMPTVEPREPSPDEAPYFTFSSEPRPKKLVDVSETVAPKPVFASEQLTLDSTPKSAAGAPDILRSIGERPPIESLSYRELLETYCFFGSAKSSPHFSNPPQIVDATESHDAFTSAQLLSAYTIGSGIKAHSPSPPASSLGSPLLDVAQSPRYTPPTGSPSLSGSQKSSAASSPLQFGTYQYQPRRSHGFTFEAPHATAIRS